MKCFALALLVVSLVIAAAPAARASGSLEWGLKAGVTSSTLNGAIRDASDPQSNTDVTGGLMLALPLGGGIAIQGEALLVTKGADIPRTNGTDKVRFRDVEFPVLARLSFMDALPVKPFIVAGPSFGYNLDATIDPADPALPKQDLKDVRKLDTAFAAGAGARMGLGAMGLTLEARYSSSLSDVQKDATNAIPGHNSVFTFMAGLVF